MIANMAAKLRSGTNVIAFTGKKATPVQLDVDGQTMAAKVALISIDISDEHRIIEVCGPDDMVHFAKTPGPPWADIMLRLRCQTEPRIITGKSKRRKKGVKK